jgi:hypothetical protein
MVYINVVVFIRSSHGLFEMNNLSMAAGHRIITSVADVLSGKGKPFTHAIVCSRGKILRGAQLRDGVTM